MRSEKNYILILTLEASMDKKSLIIIFFTFFSSALLLAASQGVTPKKYFN